MVSQITVILYTPQEFNHSSYVQTGLFELQKIGYLRVKVCLDFSKRLGRTIVGSNRGVIKTQQPHPKTSFYKIIDHQNQKSLRFAVDLYDLADQFSTFALDHCDYVFKRHFQSNYVELLPTKVKGKVYPFGLSFPINSSSNNQIFKILMGLVGSSLVMNFKIDRLIFKRLFKGFKVLNTEWHFVKKSRPLSSFENYAVANSNVLLFQTRCFPHELDADAREIHEQRYDIIKRLQQEFPNNFKGGFVPSSISKLKYGDALTNVPTRPDLYIEAVKNSKIVIYTRGLAHSPAWKLAEYLSQGKVIIAEALTAELPVQLQDGKEILFFTSLDDMVFKIHEVMADKNKQEHLSFEARTYFENNVHPAQNVKRILQLMMTT